VLRDHGRPVQIDRVLDLGSIEFGATSLEFWDPVQVERRSREVKVPSARARIFAALSGECARSLKIMFSANRVARWRPIAMATGPFGTLVLSRTGPRAEIDQLDFETSFWDDVFDDAFDSSDGAAIIELKLGGKNVPLLAWNDGQLGGTLYRGEDRRGAAAALLFDGVRVSLGD
jgi:hypothetical protein